MLTQFDDVIAVTSAAPEADLAAAFARQRKHIRRPTVLVAGYTGAGKTSLIRAICGPHVVPTDRIGDGLPKTQDFDFYEDEVIRFFDSKGLEPGDGEADFVERTRRFMRELQGRPDVDDHVHLAWYAIHGPGARVTPCDLRLIRELFSNTIVVITKADITRPRQLDAMRAALIEAGVPRNRIRACSEADPASLQALVDLSYRLLPAAYREAFIAAQRVSLEHKHVLAQAAIHSAAAAAAITGAVPIPVSDAPIITGIQLAMLASLARIYGEPEAAVRTAVLPILTQSGGLLLASSLTKWLPVVGSLIQAGVAGALTEAIGQAVAFYLELRAEARMTGVEPPHFDLSMEELIHRFHSCFGTALDQRKNDEERFSTV